MGLAHGGAVIGRIAVGRGVGQGDLIAIFHIGGAGVKVVDGGRRREAQTGVGQQISGAICFIRVLAVLALDVDLQPQLSGSGEVAQKDVGGVGISVGIHPDGPFSLVAIVDVPNHTADVVHQVFAVCLVEGICVAADAVIVIAQVHIAEPCAGIVVIVLPEHAGFICVIGARGQIELPHVVLLLMMMITLADYGDLAGFDHRRGGGVSGIATVLQERTLISIMPLFSSCHFPLWLSYSSVIVVKKEAFICAYPVSCWNRSM